MKKLLAFVLTIVMASPALADGFYESDYFEPAMVCLAAGTGGYFASSRGNEMAYAAGGCAVGAAITYFINGHYKAKYTQAYQHKLDKAMEVIKQFEQLQANKAANGDEGPYSLRVRTVVPAQKLSNGEVTAPTVRESLVIPGLDMRVGE